MSLVAAPIVQVRAPEHVFSPMAGGAPVDEVLGLEIKILMLGAIVWNSKADFLAWLICVMMPSFATFA